MTNPYRALTALVLAVALLCACAPALADGYIPAVDYGSGLYVLRSWELTGYARTQSRGYASAEALGTVETGDIAKLRVISKSASIWAEPRSNAKRIATVNHGDILWANMTYFTDRPWPSQSGYYEILYNGSYGYVNADYVALAPLEIVLMESNVPAYCAPTSQSKKVGSLSKNTRLAVLGFYDHYYIVSLRQAAAYIPMDVAHYDSTFEATLRYAPRRDGILIRKSTVRTGPGDNYPAIKEIKGSYAFTAHAVVDGWYVISYTLSDDTIYGFVPAADVQFTSGVYSVG